MIALDASALLAYMFREAGHEIVAEKIGESCISAVNLSEVISRFARDGHNSWSVLNQITQSAVETVPFLAEDAALAAALVPTARPLGLSLGGRACLALGLSRKIPVYTADRIWEQLTVEVSIQVIR